MLIRKKSRNLSYAPRIYYIYIYIVRSYCSYKFCLKTTTLTFFIILLYITLDLFLATFLWIEQFCPLFCSQAFSIVSIDRLQDVLLFFYFVIIVRFCLVWVRYLFYQAALLLVVV